MCKCASQRRDFLKATGAITASAVFGSGLSMSEMSLAASSQEGEKEGFTAEEAFKELMDGNRRFVSGNSQHPRMTEDWLKRLPKGQEPIATILACSDSRVPVELLFDQGFGDLFVIRVAGNVVTRYGIGSMEYAQHHLRTPLYMVLGHEGCGAVTAAMLPKEQRDKEPKGVRQLLNLVHVGSVDAKADAESRVTAAVEANARNSARQILELDAKTEGFQVREGDMLVAAVYEMSTGRVRILNKHH